MSDPIPLRQLQPSVLKSMGLLSPYKKAASGDGRGIVDGVKRPEGYGGSSTQPINETSTRPGWQGSMPNAPAALSWLNRNEDGSFGPGVSAANFRPEGTEYSSFKPAKGAGLAAKFAALVKKSASFAKSIDRALELNVVGQLDDRTYQGLVRYRDLLARATPSARKGFKADPEYRIVLSRIESAPIAQVDKDTLRKSLQ